MSQANQWRVMTEAMAQWL